LECVVRGAFMKRILCLVFPLLLIATISISAQQSGEHRANAGRVPPPPSARTETGTDTTRVGERLPDGRLDAGPHVNNDRWFGHDSPNDPRFHFDHPWEHGRLERIGPSFQYRIGGIDSTARRFWFTGGAFFEIPAWDWTQSEYWCWKCADDYVVYQDPDHPGWYLLYSMETAMFTHVQYLGVH
jgi:hypothetical protein